MCKLQQLKQREIAYEFRQQLRHARAVAFRDAEAFDCIIHVLERLGSFLHGSVDGLGAYKPKIEELVKETALANLDGHRNCL